MVLWSTGFVVARYATDDTGPADVPRSADDPGCGDPGHRRRRLDRAPRVDRQLVPWVVLAGMGMHVLYLGGVFVAIDRGLPAGVSALIAGLHPVLTALVSKRFLGERLVRIQWIGVGLGFAGVIAVVVDRLLTHSSRDHVDDDGCVGGQRDRHDRRHAGATQEVFDDAAAVGHDPAVRGVGGRASWCLALLWEHWDFTVTRQSIFALLWAVVVLSIAAVLLMLWLLQRRAASQVTSLFFLTPALSAVEGAILFGERLGALAVVGLLISLLGVAFVTRKAI